MTRLRQWLQRFLFSMLGKLWRGHSRPAAVQRIFILEMTRLGDVVAATSLIDALAAAYPGAALNFVADQAYAALFHGDSRLNFVGLAPRGLGFLLGAWKLRPRLRGAELAVFSASPAARNSLLCWLSKPGLACGFLFPRAGGLGYDEAQPLNYACGQDLRQALSGKEEHLVERSRKLLSLAGLESCGADPRLLSQAQRKPKLAALHAGANWAWRRWPFEKFVRLETELKARGWETVLLAPAEQMSLGSLRDLLASASLFVGNDSGPLHLAAALGTPCLGLFGPNLPSRSGPWPLDRHKVLFEEVPCRPCAQVVCVQPHDWCMDKLSVARVLQNI